jgi:hypothetical protein
MKRKVKIWFPIWKTYEEEIEVDVPEDEDPENWLHNNDEQIIQDHRLCETDIESAIDTGYAGAKFID